MNEYLEKIDGWNNENRASSLFSSFPVEINQWNSSSCDDKLAFWYNLIEGATQRKLLSDKQGSELCLNTFGLDKRFSKKNVAPLGLDKVLEHSVQNKRLLPIVNIQSRGNSVLRTLTAAFSPLIWIYESVAGTSCVKYTTQQHVFVVSSLLEVSLVHTFASIH